MQTAFSRITIRSFFLQRCIPAFHKGIRMQVKCKRPFPELEFVHFFFNMYPCLSWIRKDASKMQTAFLELDFVHFFFNNDVSLPFIRELGCK